MLATKAGWDTQKAFKVFARANANYWTPSSTFNQGACGVETAATDLGYNKADVTAAFTVGGRQLRGRRRRRHADGADQGRGDDRHRCQHRSDTLTTRWSFRPARPT